MPRRLVQPAEEFVEFGAQARWDGDLEGLGQGEEGGEVVAGRAGPGGQEADVLLGAGGVQPGQRRGVVDDPVARWWAVLQMLQDQHAAAGIGPQQCGYHSWLGAGGEP